MGTFNFGAPRYTDGVKVLNDWQDEDYIFDKMGKLGIGITVARDGFVAEVEATSMVKLISGYYNDKAVDIQEVNLEIHIYDCVEYMYEDHIELDSEYESEDHILDEYEENIVLTKELQDLITNLFDYHLTTMIPESCSVGWATGVYTPDDNWQELLRLIDKYDVSYLSNIK